MKSIQLQTNAEKDRRLLSKIWWRSPSQKLIYTKCAICENGLFLTSRLQSKSLHFCYF